jgi:hypothetical protein
MRSETICYDAAGDHEFELAEGVVREGSLEGWMHRLTGSSDRTVEEIELEYHMLMVIFNLRGVIPNLSMCPARHQCQNNSESHRIKIISRSIYGQSQSRVQLGFASNIP